MEEIMKYVAILILKFNSFCVSFINALKSRDRFGICNTHFMCCKMNISQIFVQTVYFNGFVHSFSS
jgi:hypothetical protein